jgi:hypothetical protein
MLLLVRTVKVKFLVYKVPNIGELGSTEQCHNGSCCGAGVKVDVS